MKLINIGYGNMVSAQRVIAVVSPDSAPVKRMIQEAREAGRLIDATLGRKTKSIFIMDSGHVVLAAVQSANLAGRLTGREALEDEDGGEETP